MHFNPDPKKQAQKVIFFRKSHFFFDTDILIQNHFGLIIDEKLDFRECLKDNFSVVNKGIMVSKKIQRFCSTSFVLCATSFKLCKLVMTKLVTESKVFKIIVHW